MRRVCHSLRFAKNISMCFIYNSRRAYYTYSCLDPTRGINSKPYRIPEVHREKVRRQTDQMLRDGILQPITSPWKSPISVIPRKVPVFPIRPPFPGYRSAIGYRGGRSFGDVEGGGFVL